MPNPLPRRAFLGGSAATLGFALAGAGSLDPFTSSAAAATRTSAGYGPLQPAGPLLSLPKGFSYKVIGESGRAGAGGFVHPGDPDAMGCFARPGGGSTLVTNHELAGSDQHAVPHVEGLVYDTGGIGGTTTIVLDADNTVIEQYASVSGTWNNCAGGVTPWGTWLTCEETEARAGGALTKDHGYVFEVDPTSQAANIGTAPLPLKFLGRYAHEAAAVDPATSTIYLTEDAGGPNGLYYRWTPPAGFVPGKGALHALAADGAVDVGTLEAMRCVDEDGNHVPDLSLATEVNTTYAVQWVTVPDRDARTVSVRKQFAERPGHPVAQARGPVVGRRRCLLRRELRPALRRLDQRARRPGVVLRPGEVTGPAEDHLRGEPGPRHRRRELRRPRQHHRLPARWPHPGRGRRRALAPRRGHRPGQGVPARPQPRERQRVLWPGVRRRGHHPVREHPVAGLHRGDHRAVGTAVQRAMTRPDGAWAASSPAGPLPTRGAGRSRFGHPVAPRWTPARLGRRTAGR